MEFMGYLAMTAAELHVREGLPKNTAWLSCHFSPYSTGITGIPASLPPGVMLILTDRTPVCGHDPKHIAHQLQQAVRQLQCSCVLLDLQRTGNEEARHIAREIVENLSCPVGVSEAYADGLDCPVLLSPPPLWTPLEEHAAPWKGREIWLEAVTDDALVTLTEGGSRYESMPVTGSFPFYDAHLNIAYRIETGNDVARFYLHRGKEELLQLLSQAQKLGIQTGIGLYQQLGDSFF